jgi:penicillin-binding protein 1A
MGYTPQMLAGAWVGCDDRFLRFTDNYFGQGARGALPIWAYFMRELMNDKDLKFDQKANFIKPTNMLEDYNVEFNSKDSTLIALPLEENIEKAVTVTNNQVTNNAKPPIQKTPIKNKANQEALKPKAVFTKPVKKN